MSPRTKGRYLASILCLCTAFALAARTAEAAPIASDDFTYADGSLVGNGGWVSHSGTLGDLLVSGGRAVIEHGTPSEDASLPFAPVAGVIYFGIDFAVDDLGAPYSGTDNEYFAHFKDSGFNFAARLDIVPPSGGGDYSVGIASDESTADATWATDLTYGVTYRAIVSYDQDLNIAELWIDAVVDTDTSILGEDRADPGDSIEAFALRQSDSSENEIVRVDNLCVATTFAEVVSCGGGPATGACILPNTSCVVTDATDCSNQGGAYQGDNTLCPTGACILPDTSCSIIEPFDCTTLGGAYQGDGSVCPTGACVLPNTTCIITEPFDCTSQGGSYLGDDSSCPAPMSSLVINEVDADQASTMDIVPVNDPGEFVEIFNTSTTTAVDFSVTPHVLVFYNGGDANNASYLAVDINAGSIAPLGYFVVGSEGVLNVDITTCTPAPCGNEIQNGADAVALHLGNSGLFPNGTQPSTSNLIDAVVYDTNDADDAALIAILTPGQPQINESAADAIVNSIQRCTDGAGGQLVTSEYGTGTPTPGSANNCSGSQPQGACLLADGMTCIVTDISGCSGVSGTYFGNGSSCDSLGACTVGGNCFISDMTNCMNAGGTFGGAGSECTGACCNSLTLVCTPDVTPSMCVGANEFYLGDNTDCTGGCPSQPTGLTLNEIRRDRDGADTDYVEVAGTPGTSLDGVFYVEIGDGAGASGVVENVVDLTGHTIPGDGVLLIGDSNNIDLASPAEVDVDILGFGIENSDNKTHLLVFTFFGASGDDLDTDDDCILDVTPWVGELDRVATIIATNDNLGSNVCHYGTGPADTLATQLFPGYPTHVLRLPNGSGGWRIGTFLQAGNAVFDTPGTPNILTDGACCLPNDTCTDTNFFDCADQNGAFRGEGTDCLDAGICDCSTIEDIKLDALLATGYILCDVTVVETVNQGGDFDDDRSFTVQDQSGANVGPGGTERGIRIVGDVVANPALVAVFDALAEGDIIDVVGTTEDVGGTLYLRVDAAADITETGTGGTFNVPTVSAGDFAVGSLTGENLESVRVRVPCLGFIDGGGVFSTDTSFSVTDGGTTFDARINGVDNATLPIVGTSIPQEAVDVIGVFSQFVNYQLFLHESDDLLAPTTCAGQLGACCESNGTCFQTTGPICIAAGIDGTFQGVGVACTPNPCVAATGACCISAVCTPDLTATECANMGGEYLGDDSTCAFGCPDVLGVIINEIRIDQGGTDNDEYFELKGVPGTPLDSLTYLVIGDGTGGSGVIEAVVSLAGETIQADGLFLAAEATFGVTFPTATVDLTTNLNFENSDNVTHLIVQDFSGNNGDDLDTNDDCVLDVTPWGVIVDSIALLESDNDVGGPAAGQECHYGPPSVGPDGTFVPGHVYRCPTDPMGPWLIGGFTPGTDDSPDAENPCADGACCFDGGARGAPCPCPGNFDDTGASAGLVDLADVPGFVAALLSTGDNCADINGDLAVDGLDVAGMIVLVLNSEPCVAAGCVEGLTEEDCTNMGGTFLAGLTCDPDPCGPTGACCDGGTFECADVTEAVCTANFPGRMYLGDGTTCAVDCQITAIDIGECFSQIDCSGVTEWCAYQVDAIDLAGSTCTSFLVQVNELISIPCTGSCTTGQLTFRWVDGAGPGQDCIFTATYAGGTPACSPGALGTTFGLLP